MEENNSETKNEKVEEPPKKWTVRLKKKNHLNINSASVDIS